MDKVVFLVAGEQQTEGIKYALSKGLEVHTFDNNPNHPGHKLASFSHNIDVYDEDKILEFSKAINPSAVVNFVSSHGILTGIRLREELGLKGLNRTAYYTVSSKKVFRDFLVKHEMPSPKVYASEEAVSALDGHELIAKPINGGGSRGVVHISSRTAMLSFFKSTPGKENYIIEEYINYSHRLNGDCLVVDNEIYFMIVGDYYYDSFNSLVSYATAFPSTYDYHTVERFLSSLVKKINYGTGPMNFEFIVRDDKLYCIEINPRHSGNFIHEVMSEIYGFRSAKMNVDISLNRIKHAELHERNQFGLKNNTKFYATAILFSEVDGIYEGITVDSSLDPLILRLIKFKDKGDKVSRFETLYDRVALAVMQFDSKLQMDRVLSSFRDFYEIELR